MSAAKHKAEAIWSGVLGTMPARLQSRFALVEARRRLIGLDNGDAVAAELDRLAVAEFGPDQIGDAVAPQRAAEERKPSAPTADIEEAVRLAVCRGFEGTIYITPEFLAGVQARALAEAEEGIRSRPRLNWLQRRRLRAIAKAEAELQLKPLTQRD